MAKNLNIQTSNKNYIIQGDFFCFGQNTVNIPYWQKIQKSPILHTRIFKILKSTYGLKVQSSRKF